MPARAAWNRGGRGIIVERSCGLTVERQGISAGGGGDGNRLDGRSGGGRYRVPVSGKAQGAGIDGGSTCIGVRLPGVPGFPCRCRYWDRPLPGSPSGSTNPPRRKHWRTSWCCHREDGVGRQGVSGSRKVMGLPAKAVGDRPSPVKVTLLERVSWLLAFRTSLPPRRVSVPEPIEPLLPTFKVTNKVGAVANRQSGIQVGSPGSGICPDPTGVSGPRWQKRSPTNRLCPGRTGLGRSAGPGSAWPWCNTRLQAFPGRS